MEKKLFGSLTTDEADALRASLTSGMEKQHRVTGDHEGFMETSDVESIFVMHVVTGGTPSTRITGTDIRCPGRGLPLPLWA